MYILSITQDIVDAARTLALFFCEIIYSLICFCFDIFNGFGKVRLDIDVSAIFQRVELVLGLRKRNRKHYKKSANCNNFIRKHRISI